MKHKAALFGISLLMTALSAQAQCTEVDLTSYFVPSYSGWQTASEPWTGPGGPQGSDQWYSYATNKYAHIKFSNPKSVETFTVTSSGVFETAENSVNNGSTTRTFPGSGFTWLPRYGYVCPNCTPTQTAQCAAMNTFTPCHQGEDWYNSQTCQLTSTNPPHCFLNPSSMNVGFSYNYGSSIGTLTSLRLWQREDDGTSEAYYYGLGYGLLRFESYYANGSLNFYVAASQIVPNSPIGDHACFHP